MLAGLGDGVLQTGLADVRGDDTATLGKDAQHRGLADAAAAPGDKDPSVVITLEVGHTSELLFW
ncbi:Uncharacterised protein [Mycobacteroides abscessus subsp. abscessus]|nr:Uncharacterised protein [Mycobacteroides abscessus subsp. abscessus]